MRKPIAHAKGENTTSTPPTAGDPEVIGHGDPRVVIARTSASPSSLRYAALLILLLFGIILAIIFGSMVLIPVGVAIGVLRGLQWYVSRPVPTDRLYTQTVQRSISANFPAPEKFMDAYLDRLLEAIREDVPTYSVFQAMAEIAEELYKDERSPIRFRPCRRPTQSRKDGIATNSSHISESQSMHRERSMYFIGHSGEPTSTSSPSFHR
jgi:hypothetical protein